MPHYEIAIIGAGPAGLSAGARAAKRGRSHIVLDRAARRADTIALFRRAYRVLAVPSELPLRSDLDFREAVRDEVLEAWDKSIAAAGINIRLNANVTAVTGERGSFTITIADNEPIIASYVALAIGIQGTLNKLQLPGADLPFVQYWLDEPDDIAGEKVVILGTGDAGLENALALAVRNRVSLVNLRDDFPRARPENQALIAAAIANGVDDGGVQHLANCQPTEIRPGCIALTHSGGGAVEIPCDRIIARIGAQPPRPFLETCGIKFADDSKFSLPQVSETYESEIPGLYVIGAIAGYPLIKSGLNQGWEVIEFIQGRSIQPADEPLIQSLLSPEKVQMLDPGKSVITGYELIQELRDPLPFFSSFTRMQIREALLSRGDFLGPRKFGAKLRLEPKGAAVSASSDVPNGVFWIITGEVIVATKSPFGETRRSLGPGEFFNALTVLGRKHEAGGITAGPSLLLELPGEVVGELREASSEGRDGFNAAMVRSYLTAFLADKGDHALIDEIAKLVEVHSFRAGDILIDDASADRPAYAISDGEVAVFLRVGTKEFEVDRAHAGNLVGLMAATAGARHSATVRAAGPTDAIMVNTSALKLLQERIPNFVEILSQGHLEHTEQWERAHATTDDEILKALVRIGAGPGIDVVGDVTVPQDLPISMPVTEPSSAGIIGQSVEAGRIFISFCSANEAAAADIVSRLEASGLSCWISNRDVWGNYQEDIVDAIGTASAMVLVFSKEANGSEEMKKELSLAAHCKIPKIPVRIEDVRPSRAFEYELATSQYIDLFRDPSAATQRLVQALRRLVPN